MYTTDILFEIVSTNIDNNNIVVRPYSTQYANPISSYPTFNVSISLLDPTQDINVQIAKLCAGVVNTTLLKESSAFNTLTDYVNSNINNTISVPVSSAFPETTIINTTYVAPVFPGPVPLSGNDINFVA